MTWVRNIISSVKTIGCVILCLFSIPLQAEAEKIGVIYALHGGMDEYAPQYLFDAAVHQFTYDPNHPVHQLVIWDLESSAAVLDSEFSQKFIGKYEFEYERIGGIDPFHAISDAQLQDIKAALDTNTEGFTFEVDFANWMSGDRPEHYPYPRYLYYPPEPGAEGITYCGEQETESVVLDFTAGSFPFTPGGTLSGPSGATALIEDAVLRSGSWSNGDAEGTLVLSGLTYTQGVCGSSGNSCTPSGGCGFLEMCLGDYFNDGDSLSDASGGTAVASGTHHWPDCDPDRYDVDGPVERLLHKGVTRIVVIDTTVGGVRFFKTYDIVQMTRKALDDWNAAHETSIPLVWVNDYTNLMERSYPSQPTGWTPIMGPPEADRHAEVSESPNPVAEDPELALLHVEGIEAVISDEVPDSLTGVILFNHGLFDANRLFFDPKIDDTIVLNQNIKSLLLQRHPDMDPDNIVGAYGGIKDINPENGLLERTREMRGESLAYCNLHESEDDMPGGEWGYRYWEAQDYLKNRGVGHVVVGFPQVISDSVLTLVELYNQIAAGFGIKSWYQWGSWDFSAYPGVGHPFAEYWGNWVHTDCGGEECCFEMGGCADGRDYPPPRQAPLDVPLDDMDPSLAYDLSDYGHLGYDPALGPPNTDHPVQAQYTGTWDIYTPPSYDPRVGELLAKHVLAAATRKVVRLVDLKANAGSRKVRLQWETASESKNVGFNIYRADAAKAEYVRINEHMIAAKGSVDRGESYEYVDRNVHNRTTYYYKLEDVDRFGTATLHGPVHATPLFLHLIRNH